MPVLATAVVGACAPLGRDIRPGLGPVGWTQARANYGSDPAQSVYIRRPEGLDQPLATVFILSSATPSKADEILAAQIADAGMVAMVVGRRPSPVAAFPAYISDSAKAMAWCVERAGQVGVASDQMGLLGLSSGGLHAQMLAADGRYLEAVGQVGRVKAVAVVGPDALPDATFTHPTAYAPSSRAPRLWRGEEFEISGAIHHLKQNLNATRST